MADTAPAVVLDSPSSGARSNTRRKPETSRPAGNRLVIRIARPGQQPGNTEGGASSSPPQQSQQQDQQQDQQQQDQQQQQAGQPEQRLQVPPAQQQQQRQRVPRAPAAAADSDVIVIDSDSDDDDDEVVITGVTLPKKRPRQVLQQQQPRALPQQQQQQLPGMPAMPTWDPQPVVPQRERSPEPAFKCLICLDGIKADCMATTPCGHMFCYECIMDAVRATKKCPKCRKSTTLKQIKRLYPN